MKKVVSVSLGSRKRDFEAEAEYLGEVFSISRSGTDGSLDEYARKLRELDGNVDAIGLGGLDMYVFAGTRRYAFRDTCRLAANAKTTPVADGSGLKNTLERQAVRWVQQEGIVDFRACNTLIVCAVDRFGMAEEVAGYGGRVVYGDLMFNLGLPVAIRRWSTVERLARLLLPVIVKLPFSWLYPTGKKQENVTPKYGWAYEWADVIAGDFHLIRRYLPEGENSLAGKTVITNTTTSEDCEQLARRGLARLITTTQSFGGRSAGTNVLEAVLVAASGKRPEELTEADYNSMLERLDWRPEVRELQ